MFRLQFKILRETHLLSPEVFQKYKNIPSCSYKKHLCNYLTVPMSRKLSKLLNTFNKQTQKRCSLNYPNNTNIKLLTKSYANVDNLKSIIHKISKFKNCKSKKSAALLKKITKAISSKKCTIKKFGIHSGKNSKDYSCHSKVPKDSLLIKIELPKEEFNIAKSFSNPARLTHIRSYNTLCAKYSKLQHILSKISRNNFKLRHYNNKNKDEEKLFRPKGRYRKNSLNKLKTINKDTDKKVFNLKSGDCLMKTSNIINNSFHELTNYHTLLAKMKKHNFAHNTEKRNRKKIINIVIEISGMDNDYSNHLANPMNEVNPEELHNALKCTPVKQENILPFASNQIMEKMVKPTELISDECRNQKNQPNEELNGSKRNEDIFVPDNKIKNAHDSKNNLTKNNFSVDYIPKENNNLTVKHVDNKTKVDKKMESVFTKSNKKLDALDVKAKFKNKISECALKTDKNILYSSLIGEIHKKHQKFGNTDPITNNKRITSVLNTCTESNAKTGCKNEISGSFSKTYDKNIFDYSIIRELHHKHQKLAPETEITNKNVSKTCENFTKIKYSKNLDMKGKPSKKEVLNSSSNKYVQMIGLTPNKKNHERIAKLNLKNRTDHKKWLKFIYQKTKKLRKIKRDILNDNCIKKDSKMHWISFKSEFNITKHAKPLYSLRESNNQNNITKSKRKSEVNKNKNISFPYSEIKTISLKKSGTEDINNSVLYKKKNKQYNITENDLQTEFENTSFNNPCECNLYETENSIIDAPVTCEDAAFLKKETNNLKSEEIQTQERCISDSTKSPDLTSKDKINTETKLESVSNKPNLYSEIQTEHQNMNTDTKLLNQNIIDQHTKSDKVENLKPLSLQKQTNQKKNILVVKVQSETNKINVMLTADIKSETINDNNLNISENKNTENIVSSDALNKLKSKKDLDSVPNTSLNSNKNEHQTINVPNVLECKTKDVQNNKAYLSKTEFKFVNNKCPGFKNKMMKHRIRDMLFKKIKPNYSLFKIKPYAKQQYYWEEDFCPELKQVSQFGDVTYEQNNEFQSQNKLKTEKNDERSLVTNHANNQAVKGNNTITKDQSGLNEECKTESGNANKKTTEHQLLSETLHLKQNELNSDFLVAQPFLQNMFFTNYAINSTINNKYLTKAGTFHKDSNISTAHQYNNENNARKQELLVALIKFNSILSKEVTKAIDIDSSSINITAELYAQLKKLKHLLSKETDKSKFNNGIQHHDDYFTSENHREYESFKADLLKALIKFNNTKTDFVLKEETNNKMSSLINKKSEVDAANKALFIPENKDISDNNSKIKRNKKQLEKIKYSLNNKYDKIIEKKHNSKMERNKFKSNKNYGDNNNKLELLKFTKCKSITSTMNNLDMKLHSYVIKAFQSKENINYTRNNETNKQNYNNKNRFHTSPVMQSKFSSKGPSNNDKDKNNKKSHHIPEIYKINTMRSKIDKKNITNLVNKAPSVYKVPDKKNKYKKPYENNKGDKKNITFLKTKNQTNNEEISKKYDFGEFHKPNVKPKLKDNDNSFSIIELHKQYLKKGSKNNSNKTESIESKRNKIKNKSEDSIEQKSTLNLQTESKVDLNQIKNKVDTVITNKPSSQSNVKTDNKNNNFDKICLKYQYPFLNEPFCNKDTKITNTKKKIKLLEGENKSSPETKMKTDNLKNILDPTNDNRTYNNQDKVGIKNSAQSNKPVQDKEAKSTLENKVKPENKASNENPFSMYKIYNQDEFKMETYNPEQNKIQPKKSKQDDKNYSSQGTEMKFKKNKKDIIMNIIGTASKTMELQQKNKEKIFSGTETISGIKTTKNDCNKSSEDQIKAGQNIATSKLKINNDIDLKNTKSKPAPQNLKELKSENKIKSEYQVNVSTEQKSHGSINIHDKNETKTVKPVKDMNNAKSGSYFNESKRKIENQTVNKLKPNKSSSENNINYNYQVHNFGNFSTRYKYLYPTVSYTSSKGNQYQNKIETANNKTTPSPDTKTQNEYQFNMNTYSYFSEPHETTENQNMNNLNHHQHRMNKSYSENNINYDYQVHNYANVNTSYKNLYPVKQYKSKENQFQNNMETKSVEHNKNTHAPETKTQNQNQFYSKNYLYFNKFSKTTENQNININANYQVHRFGNVYTKYKDLYPNEAFRSMGDEYQNNAAKVNSDAKIKNDYQYNYMTSNSYGIKNMNKLDAAKSEQGTTLKSSQKNHTNSEYQANNLGNDFSNYNYPYCDAPVENNANQYQNNLETVKPTENDKTTISSEMNMGNVDHFDNSYTTTENQNINKFDAAGSESPSENNTNSEYQVYNFNNDYTKYNYPNYKTPVENNANQYQYQNNMETLEDNKNKQSPETENTDQYNFSNMKNDSYINESYNTADNQNINNLDAIKPEKDATDKSSPENDTNSNDQKYKYTKSAENNQNTHSPEAQIENKYHFSNVKSDLYLKKKFKTTEKQNVNKLGPFKPEKNIIAKSSLQNNTNQYQNNVETIKSVDDNKTKNKYQINTTKNDSNINEIYKIVEKPNTNIFDASVNSKQDTTNKSSFKININSDSNEIKNINSILTPQTYPKELNQTTEQYSKNKLEAVKLDTNKSEEEQKKLFDKTAQFTNQNNNGVTEPNNLVDTSIAQTSNYTEQDNTAKNIEFKTAAAEKNDDSQDLRNAIKNEEKTKECIFKYFDDNNNYSHLDEYDRPSYYTFTPNAENIDTNYISNSKSTTKSEPALNKPLQTTNVQSVNTYSNSITENSDKTNQATYNNQISYDLPKYNNNIANKVYSDTSSQNMYPNSANVYQQNSNGPFRAVYNQNITYPIKSKSDYSIDNTPFANNFDKTGMKQNINKEETFTNNKNMLLATDDHLDEYDRPSYNIKNDIFKTKPNILRVEVYQLQKDEKGNYNLEMRYQYINADDNTIINMEDNGINNATKQVQNNSLINHEKKILDENPNNFNYTSDTFNSSNTVNNNEQSNFSNTNQNNTTHQKRNEIKLDKQHSNFSPEIGNMTNNFNNSFYSNTTTHDKSKKEATLSESFKDKPYLDNLKKLDAETTKTINNSQKISKKTNADQNLEKANNTFKINTSNSSTDKKLVSRYMKSKNKSGSQKSNEDKKLLSSESVCGNNSKNTTMLSQSKLSNQNLKMVNENNNNSNLINSVIAANSQNNKTLTSDKHLGKSHINDIKVIPKLTPSQDLYFEPKSEANKNNTLQVSPSQVANTATKSENVQQNSELQNITNNMRPQFGVQSVQNVHKLPLERKQSHKEIKAEENKNEMIMTVFRSANTEFINEKLNNMEYQYSNIENQTNYFVPVYHSGPTPHFNKYWNSNQNTNYENLSPNSFSTNDWVESNQFSKNENRFNNRENNIQSGFTVYPDHSNFKTTFHSGPSLYMNIKPSVSKQDTRNSSTQNYNMGNEIANVEHMNSEDIKVDRRTQNQNSYFVNYSENVDPAPQGIPYFQSKTKEFNQNEKFNNTEIVIGNQNNTNFQPEITTDFYNYPTYASGNIAFNQIEAEDGDLKKSYYDLMHDPKKITRTQLQTFEPSQKNFRPNYNLMRLLMSKKLFSVTNTNKQNDQEELPNSQWNEEGNLQTPAASESLEHNKDIIPSYIQEQNHAENQFSQTNNETSDNNSPHSSYYLAGQNEDILKLFRPRYTKTVIRHHNTHYGPRKNQFFLTGHLYTPFEYFAHYKAPNNSKYYFSSVSKKQLEISEIKDKNISPPKISKIEKEVINTSEDEPISLNELLLSDEKYFESNNHKLIDRIISSYAEICSENQEHTNIQKDQTIEQSVESNDLLGKLIISMPTNEQSIISSNSKAKENKNKLFKSSKILPEEKLYGCNKYLLESYKVSNSSPQEKLKNVHKNVKLTSKKIQVNSLNLQKKKCMPHLLDIKNNKNKTVCTKNNNKCIADASNQSTKQKNKLFKREIPKTDLLATSAVKQDAHKKSILSEIFSTKEHCNLNVLTSNENNKITSSNSSKNLEENTAKTTEHKSKLLKEENVNMNSLNNSLNHSSKNLKGSTEKTNKEKSKSIKLLNSITSKISNYEKLYTKQSELQNVSKVLPNNKQEKLSLHEAINKTIPSEKKYPIVVNISMDSFIKDKQKNTKIISKTENIIPIVIKESVQETTSDKKEHVPQISLRIDNKIVKNDLTQNNTQYIGRILLTPEKSHGMNSKNITPEIVSKEMFLGKDLNNLVFQNSKFSGQSNTTNENNISLEKRSELDKNIFKLNVSIKQNANMKSTTLPPNTNESDSLQKNRKNNNIIDVLKTIDRAKEDLDTINKSHLTVTKEMAKQAASESQQTNINEHKSPPKQCDTNKFLKDDKKYMSESKENIKNLINILLEKVKNELETVNGLNSLNANRKKEGSFDELIDKKSLDVLHDEKKFVKEIKMEKDEKSLLTIKDEPRDKITNTFVKQLVFEEITPKNEKVSAKEKKIRQEEADTLIKLFDKTIQAIETISVNNLLNLKIKKGKTLLQENNTGNKNLENESLKYPLLQSEGNIIVKSMDDLGNQGNIQEINNKSNPTISALIQPVLLDEKVQETPEKPSTTKLKSAEKSASREVSKDKSVEKETSISLTPGSGKSLETISLKEKSTKENIDSSIKDKQHGKKEKDSSVVSESNIIVKSVEDLNNQGNKQKTNNKSSPTTSTMIQPVLVDKKVQETPEKPSTTKPKSAEKSASRIISKDKSVDDETSKSAKSLQTIFLRDKSTKGKLDSSKKDKQNGKKKKDSLVVNKKTLKKVPSKSNKNKKIEIQNNPFLEKAMQKFEEDVIKTIMKSTSNNNYTPNSKPRTTQIKENIKKALQLKGDFDILEKILKNKLQQEPNEQKSKKPQENLSDKVITTENKDSSTKNDVKLESLPISSENQQNKSTPENEVFSSSDHKNPKQDLSPIATPNKKNGKAPKNAGNFKFTSPNFIATEMMYRSVNRKHPSCASKMEADVIRSSIARAIAKKDADNSQKLMEIKNSIDDECCLEKFSDSNIVKRTKTYGHNRDSVLAKSDLMFTSILTEESLKEISNQAKHDEQEEKICKPDDSECPDKQIMKLSKEDKEFMEFRKNSTPYNGFSNLAPSETVRHKKKIYVFINKCDDEKD